MKSSSAATAHEKPPNQVSVLTRGPVFQGEGSKLAAGEQGEHLGTHWHNHSSEATTSSVHPKAKTHFPVILQQLHGWVFL